MINANTHSNRCPLLLKPFGKSYLWGGERLKTEYSKNIDLSPLAETWECSSHPEGQSTIDGGIFDGKTLREVISEHPSFLGVHSEKMGDLPILIKFIDAKLDLSVQVHPNDEYAVKHENGALGKTEMWYVLDAAPDAKIIYGLHQSINRSEAEKSLKCGCFEKYLQKISVKKNDIFFINPGLIHAIGQGVLIAEIQQNSNITYRLYDYNRKDRTGKPRDLHIDKGLDVADLHSSDTPIQPMRVLKYRPGCAEELLVRCSHFQVERMLINTERIKKMISCKTDNLSFHVLLCLDGCGIITWENEYILFFKGDCLFLPADSVEVRIHGKAQLLNISC